MNMYAEALRIARSAPLKEDKFDGIFLKRGDKRHTHAHLVPHHYTHARTTPHIANKDTQHATVLDPTNFCKPVSCIRCFRQT